MRIAISGSHRTGKSTLVEALSALLPNYTTVDEPYYVMSEHGHEFNDPPGLEDFEAQLEHSIASLNEGDEQVLFDRCPVDFVAYISAHDDAESFDQGDWLPRVRDAVQTLDLVVFVPIEPRDRIPLSLPVEESELRTAVDRKLKEIWLEDPFELGVNVVSVEGEPEQRARTALQQILRSPR